MKQKGIFGTLKEAWESIDGYDKAKFLTRILCMFGSGCIGGEFLNRYYEDSVDFGIVEKVAVFTTVYGVSSGMGVYAGNQLCKTIDAVKAIRTGMTLETEEVTEKEEQL